VDDLFLRIFHVKCFLTYFFRWIASLKARNDRIHTLTHLNSYKKDSKFKEPELNHVINALMNSGQLNPKYNNHKLTGDWDDYWDCHVQNDIILLYKIENGKLKLSRIASHAELFG